MRKEGGVAATRAAPGRRWTHHWPARSRWSPGGPGSGPRDRGAARGGRGDGLRHRAHDPIGALGDGPAGDDRGDRGARGRGRRARASPSRSTTSCPTRCAALVERIEAEQGAPARARQRHLGRHHDGVGQDGLGVVAGHRAAHAAAGGRHPRHHQPLRPPAAHQVAGRAGRRGDRRDRRVQRRRTTACRSSTTWPRPRTSAWRSRSRTSCEPYGATAVALTPGWLRSEAMLEAFGVTESNWRDATERRRRTSPSPRARRSSAGPSSRWPPIPTWRAGTARRCRAGSWPGSTASPTSTAASPTPGGTSPEVQDAGQPADTTGYR